MLLRGLSWLWCRYLQNSQLLQPGAKLLSRGKTPVLFDQNHRGSWRPLRTERHETSVQPFTWTHHCSGHFASCFTGSCHHQHVISASSLRCWVSHKPQSDSLHAEVVLCSICISLKPQQSSHLHIPLPLLPHTLHIFPSSFLPPQSYIFFLYSTLFTCQAASCLPIPPTPTAAHLL